MKCKDCNEPAELGKTFCADCLDERCVECETPISGDDDRCVECQALDLEGEVACDACGSTLAFEELKTWLCGYRAQLCAGCGERADAEDMALDAYRGK